MAAGSPSFSRSKRLLTLPEAIMKAGGWPGLECVIDPKHPGCYQGGQTLFDMSGKGMDFWSGQGAGVDAGDLAMVGEPGRRTMGNIFTKAVSLGLVTAKATSAFQNSMHKANAQWTFLQISDFNFNVAGNSWFTNLPGVQFSFSFPPGGLGLHFYVYRANASSALSVDSVAGFHNNNLPFGNRAYFCCTTMDDVAGVFTYHMNDIVDTHFGHYVTPDTLDPGGPIQVGANGNNNGPMWGSFEDSCTFALWSRPVAPQIIQRIRKLLMPVYRFGL